MPRVHSTRFRATRALERGASIIELMVGVLIGMIVVAVVYNVLVMAEGYKRSTIGVADAQVTGQLTQFVVGRELANGGASMMTSVDELSRCADWRLKALPAAITAGADANTSDELLVFYSTSPRIAHPVRFSNFSNTTPTQFIVDSPNGFKVGDWVIATNRATNCALTRATGILQPDDSAYPPANIDG
jgi:type IV pilus assembly protein PilW